MTSDIRFNISKPEIYYEDGEELCEWEITETENRCKCSVYFYTHEPEKVYIANVNTQPEHRRQGFASKMFEAAFVFIKAMQQFSTVYLWVDDDSWMKQWYFRLGFRYLYHQSDSNYVWLYFPLECTDK